MFGLTITKKAKIEDFQNKVECQEIIIKNLRETLQEQRAKNTELRIDIERYKPVQGKSGKFVRKVAESTNWKCPIKAKKNPQ